MIKLALSPTGPIWVDLLPGVRFQIRPPETLDVLHAREAARGVYLADAEAETKDPAVSVEAGVAMVRAYAYRVVTGWEGLGDESGEPLAVSPAAIDAAMAHPALYERFETEVFAPALRIPTAPKAPPAPIAPAA